MRVVQVFGVEGLDAVPAATDADAVVVALKSRSLPKASAIEQSLAALQTLQDRGAQRIYFKYCSTFDSTPDGNIGPVAEALRQAISAEQCLYCPAFPEAGRTVFNGHLFVNRRLLHESPLRDHPLTPMTDADVVRFLGQQIPHSVGLLPHDIIDAGVGACHDQLHTLRERGVRHIIADTCHEQHLQTLATVVAGHSLVTGGSGLARFLPAALQQAASLPEFMADSLLPQIPGRSAVIAGSCSAATVAQVQQWKLNRPAWEIDVPRIVSQRDSELRQLREWITGLPDHSPLLISSSATPHRVAELQARFGVETVAHAVEDGLSLVAQLLFADFGVRRFVVAGGETSGAVTRALGVRAVRIGPSICPGVPWTETVGASRPLALALKSGNFGERRFFAQALEMLP